MTLMGRLHPLLVHFPIALILIAAVAELVAMATRLAEWRAVAVWLLASSRIVEASPLLERHRWLGTYAAIVAMGAALTTGRVVDSPSSRRAWVYRVAVFCAAGLVGIAGHLGAVLVWGADFL